MKDLAFKERKDLRDDMYPSMGKKEKRYPNVTLPLHLLGDKDVNLNDEVTVTLKGKVTRVEKSEYDEDFCVRATLGEIKEEEKKTIAG